MRAIFLSLLLPVCHSALAAHPEPSDSVSRIDIEETVVISAPKETGKLRNRPVSVSLFDNKLLEASHSESLKDLSDYVPNFYMPDYGSALTSAMYIRGIGSRINTPAVGLYVDNVAYADKSAFDLHFLDIERVDILRGPQGTLYGRNTMGGLIRIFTRNPFRYKGTDVRLGYSSRENGHKFSATHYHYLGSKTAFSGSVFYEGGRGLYKNVFRNERVDKQSTAGARLHLMCLPSDDWKIEFGADYAYLDQGGYAYRYLGAVDPEEESMAEYKGRIFSNLPSFYRRGVFNSNVTLTYTSPRTVLTSVTAYQNLSDNMTLDQDFTSRDFFTLTQKQRINSWSEELTLKSRTNKRWEWTNGIYGLYQTLHTNSPVTLSEEFMRSTLNEANAFMQPNGMSLDLKLNNPPFRTGGTFDTPLTDIAVFHQSTFNNLFGLDGLSLTAGVRVEHERTRLDYNYGGTLNYDLNLNMGRMPLISLDDQTDASHFNGRLRRDYTQCLPKVAVSYAFNKHNNIYASWSKGYRSGGFNVQMFSDLIQGEAREQMMGHVNSSMQQAMQRPPLSMMPDRIKDLILDKLSYTYNGSPESTVFKPEYSYNYEVGSHLAFFGGKLQLDAAAFYMDVYDQQISKFVGSDLGRAMVNAGRGQSYGAEIAWRGVSSDDRITWYGSYGYTHSTFKEYDPGQEDLTATAQAGTYNGNYVPFVPRHTYAVGIDYTWPIRNNRAVKSVSLGVNSTGAGSIYWNEENTLSQPFYALLGAHATIDLGVVNIDVWGKNLTDTRYDTFCFTSKATFTNLKFAQQGRPLQVGADVKIHF